MAVSVGFNSYLLLSVLCFGSLVSCSEISTEGGQDGPSAVSEQTTTMRSTERGRYRTPRRASGKRYFAGNECLGEEQCGFQMYDRDTKEPTHPFIPLCSCPEGLQCVKTGDLLHQRSYFYKCRENDGSEEDLTEHVDSENEGGASSPNRVEPTEGMVDSAATTPNDASTVDGGMDEAAGSETASTEFYSTWKDRVGHFEDHFEL